MVDAQRTKRSLLGRGVSAALPMVISVPEGSNVGWTSVG
jgi:hypothetical protein